jgi:hypothetical protein
MYLHCLLVVQTVALFTAAARTKTKPSVVAYVVLLLAAATRFETLFVAAAIGVTLLFLVNGGALSRSARSRRRQSSRSAS